MLNPSSTTHRVVARAFQNDEDFWRIRHLLIETYPLTGRGWNWDIRRWDGARFYDPDPTSLSEEWQRTVWLWEAVDGRLMGALNPDGPGRFCLQLRPDCREIEEEMITWAEENLAKTAPDGASHTVGIEVFEYDAPRRRILERHGYQQQPGGSVMRWMPLRGQPIPAAPLAGGYQMRCVHGEDLADCQRIADLLNAAFNRTFHNAGEFYQFARSAPAYRQDLHLVAVAPDGSFAAHVAVIYDEENRRGLFEPVCTHPQHRRKRLAQSLMFEGMRRLERLGAAEVTVETGIDMLPANALYNAIGFTEMYKSHPWQKIW